MITVIEGGGNRGQLQQTAAYRLRKMTANLMRVVAGAGKPEDVEQDAYDFLSAMQELHKLGEGWNFDAFSEALSVADHRRDVGDERDHARWEADGTFARAEAINTIVRGCLRLPASRLTGGRAQEAHGETLIMQGVRDFEEWKKLISAHWRR